ncbi:MAG: TetR/AcrR family transcriptional regulator [Solirubrobacterales bacterium]
MSSETADRILEAACELIAEDGIDEVRIARVAQRAGASTSLVHHYFSTREELLEQALIHSFEQAGDERFGAEVAAGGAVETLAAAIRDSLPYPGGQEREWVLWVELWLRAVREPDLRPVAARLYDRYRRWMADVVVAGVDGGEFAADTDVERVANLGVAMLDGTGVRALLDDPEMDVEAARALVADVLGDAVGIDPKRLLG